MAYGVGTSTGEYYDSEEDYHHEKVFGPPPQQADEGKEPPKVYGIRHGCTDLNDADKIHGWVDEPLNKEGIEQAHKAAESLKDKDLTELHTSPLPRAMQTARIIADKLGGIPIKVDPRLMTWDSGDFDYTNKHDEFEKYTRAAVAKPNESYQAAKPTSPLEAIEQNVDPTGGSDEIPMSLFERNEADRKINKSLENLWLNDRKNYQEAVSGAEKLIDEFQAKADDFRTPNRDKEFYLEQARKLRARNLELKAFHRPDPVPMFTGRKDI